MYLGSRLLLVYCNSYLQYLVPVSQYWSTKQYAEYRYLSSYHTVMKYNIIKTTTTRTKQTQRRHHHQHIPFTIPGCPSVSVGTTRQETASIAHVITTSNCTNATLPVVWFVDDMAYIRSLVLLYRSGSCSTITFISVFVITTKPCSKERNSIGIERTSITLQTIL